MIKMSKFLFSLPATVALVLTSGMVSAVTINFDAMPAAVFGPQTGGAGYDEGGYNFAPLVTTVGFGAHIHGEDTDGDGEKELNYHADAGGWGAVKNDGGMFNLESMNLTTIGDSQGDFSNPAIFEVVGGANDGFLLQVPQSTPTGLLAFGAEFMGISGFQVYFDGQKGMVPATGSPADGFFLSVDDLVVTPSAVPVPAAVWMFGSGLLGLMGMRRKKLVTV